MRRRYRDSARSSSSTTSSSVVSSSTTASSSAISVDRQNRREPDHKEHRRADEEAGPPGRSSFGELGDGVPDHRHQQQRVFASRRARTRLRVSSACRAHPCGSSSPAESMPVVACASRSAICSSMSNGRGSSDAVTSSEIRLCCPKTPDAVASSEADRRSVSASELNFDASVSICWSWSSVATSSTRGGLGEVGDVSHVRDRVVDRSEADLDLLFLLLDRLSDRLAVLEGGAGSQLSCSPREHAGGHGDDADQQRHQPGWE